MSSEIYDQRQAGHGLPGGELVEWARHALQLHHLAFEGTDSLSVRVPSSAVEELMQSLARTVRDKVEQIVPFAPHSLSGNPFSSRIWRTLARRFDVHRFYLVPCGEENRREVDRLVVGDLQYRLHSVPVAVTGWNDAVPMSTLWLIDDKIVVRQEPGIRGQGSWLVTGRLPEVRRARKLIDVVREQAAVQAPGVGPEITALMLTSADHMYHAAQMSCTGNPMIDEAGCVWYHASWQYLRLFDMVSSPTWHAAFYSDQLREVIHRRLARRILISGAADYTTLAFVLDAARVADGTLPPDLDVHVIDVCPTPLSACRWYAKKLGARVTLHQGDITRPGETGIGDEEAFDVVVADAFLTRFDSGGAGEVLSRWFDLLGPGGTVVTTVRLHPGNQYVDQETYDHEIVGQRRVTDPVDDFELRLRERATRWRDMLSIDLENISQAAREYAKRMISHDLGDGDDVKKLFDDHEFELVQGNAARVRGELVGTEYLRVIARRPVEQLAQPVLD